MAAFLELDDRSSMAASSSEDAFADEWKHVFAPMPLLYSFSNGHEYDDDDAKVEVLTDTTFLVRAFLASDADWQPIAAYLAMLPELLVPRRSKAAGSHLPKASQIDPEVLLANPWLLDALKRTTKPKTSTTEPSEGGHDKAEAEVAVALEPESSDSESGAGELDEQLFDLDAAVEELEKKREEVGKGLDEHFQWKVMGGKWCMERFGVPYDSFRSTFKSQQAKQFLMKYQFHQSCSFTLAKFGEVLARTLAEYWVSKMAWYFSVWEDKEFGNHIFTQEECDAFVEPEIFTRAFDASEGTVRARMVELRALKPGAPK